MKEFDPKSPFFRGTPETFKNPEDFDLKVHDVGNDLDCMHDWQHLERFYDPTPFGLLGEYWILYTCSKCNAKFSTAWKPPKGQSTDFPAGRPEFNQKISSALEEKRTKNNI